MELHASGAGGGGALDRLSSEEKRGTFPGKAAVRESEWMEAEQIVTMTESEAV